jgi:hypothetical protein
MPVVSRFFGILVVMHWRDHHPPHFHARYGSQEVAIDIASGMVTGDMNRRALSLLEEWRQLHQEELLVNWNLAEERRALIPIPPLE